MVVLRNDEERREAENTLALDVFKLLAQPHRGQRTDEAVRHRASELGLDVDVKYVDGELRVNAKREPTVDVARAIEHLRSTSSTPYESAKAGLVEDYGPKLGTFLANRLAKMIRTRRAECLSDLRVCIVGDPVSTARYKQIERGGCCGSAEEDFVYTIRVFGIPVTRRVYRVGFNYGH